MCSDMLYFTDQVAQNGLEICSFASCFRMWDNNMFVAVLVKDMCKSQTAKKTQ